MYKYSFSGQQKSLGKNSLFGINRSLINRDVSLTVLQKCYLLAIKVLFQLGMKLQLLFLLCQPTESFDVDQKRENKRNNPTKKKK